MDTDTGAITGTLNYISDYSSAFGQDMDSGNYLAFHVDTGDIKDATITVTRTQTVTLDEDGIVVLYVSDTTTPIVVTVSADGYDTVTYTFDDLSGLTLSTE